MADVTQLSPGAVAGLAGICGAGGSGLAIWFSKLMLQRLVRQYDERHEKHDAKFEKIAERFGDALADLKTKLAVIEVSVAETKSLRADVKEVVQKVTSELAVVKDRSSKLRADVNEAHTRIRAVQGDVKALRVDVDASDH